MFSKAFSALLVTALAVSASPAAPLEVQISPFHTLPILNIRVRQARQACAKTYTVVSGDTCAAIESRTGVSDSQLHVLNPSINSGCTSTSPSTCPCQLSLRFCAPDLQIGQSLCVSGGGGSPPSGGCGQTYTVVSGDTCAVIESKTGVSDSQLHALNPAINSGCTSMFPSNTCPFLSIFAEFFSFFPFF
jgi:hypothetical protein